MALSQKRQTVSAITRIVEQSECWQGSAQGPNWVPGVERIAAAIAVVVGWNCLGGPRMMIVIGPA
jgi:hypothetical protein